MKRKIVVWTLVSILCVVSPALAQQPTAPTPPANPKDVSSVDAIIAAVYDANTVMVDKKLSPDRFRSLFYPEVRFNSTVPGASHSARLRTWTIDDYVRTAMAGPPRGGFSEREIARSSQSFGHIVQAFSTYRTYRDSTDKHPIHGINSFQLFNDGTRWWVLNVLWDTERPDQPIPSIYLPKKP
jgi:proline-rich tail region repeat protein